MMDGVGEFLSGVMSHPQEEVNPEMPGDYTGRDGLLYCGACHGKKQTRVNLFGREFIVPVTCRCRQEELRREAARQEEKQRELAASALRASSLMPGKFRAATFGAYIRRPENEKAYRMARGYVDNFEQMYGENQGILFYGPVGTGKSYTAACIANALLDKGVSVVMTSLVKILQEIQSGRMDEDSCVRMMDGARLLIFDDLGAERNTDYALEKVYNVVDSRVRSNKPMILTTNLSLEAMKGEQDIRYRRIYDRIFENCYPLKLTGRSFRTEEGNRRYVRMNRMMEGYRD